MTGEGWKEGRGNGRKKRSRATKSVHKTGRDEREVKLGGASGHLRP